MKTYKIMFWFVEELLFVKFPIEDGIPSNRQERKRNIVELVKPKIIDISCAKPTNATKCQDWHHINYIFVESEADHVRILSVGFATMTKHKIFKHFELSYRIVGSTCGLCSFKPTNSYSNLCSCYHTDIICTISNCKH